MKVKANETIHGDKRIKHIINCSETYRVCSNRRKKPTRSHLLFYFTSYRLNMFRALLCSSSGARDYDVDYHIGRSVL